jgi:adenylate cyclase
VIANPGRLEAGLELLCDAEIIQAVAGAGSVSTQCYRFTQTLLQSVIFALLTFSGGENLARRLPAVPEL